MWYFGEAVRISAYGATDRRYESRQAVDGGAVLLQQMDPYSQDNSGRYVGVAALLVVQVNMPSFGFYSIYQQASHTVLFSLAVVCTSELL